MDAVDRLTVAMIDAFSPGSRHVTAWPDYEMDDRQLLETYGHNARPLAEALQAVIREEVARCLAEREVTTSGR